MYGVNWPNYATIGYFGKERHGQSASNAMILKLKKASTSLPQKKLNIFLWVWLGQLISGIGTQLTLFSMGVFVYQKSQSVSQFAWMILVIYLPPILLTPIAGYLADHYHRRLIMIVTDAGAIAGILILGWLLRFDYSVSWQIYLLLGISSAFSSLQVPAYLAATTLMVPKEFLSRANGLIMISHSIIQLIAPFIAPWLILSVQLPGIVLLDFLSFCLVFIILLMVRFPEIVPSWRSRSITSDFNPIQETQQGWNYIRNSPSLLALLLLIGTTYGTLGATEVLFTPLVLSFATVEQLGLLLSMAGLGWLAGSLMVSLWRSPPSLIKPIIGGVFIQGLMLMGTGGEWTIKIFPVFIFGIVCYCIVCPIILSFNQTIWQQQIDPKHQGQVFATRLAIEWSFRLIVLLLAAPLADNIFEPFFQGDTWLLNQMSFLTGRGEGRGIAVLLSIIGIINIFVASWAYFYSPLLKLNIKKSL